MNKFAFGQHFKDTIIERLVISFLLLITSPIILLLFPALIKKPFLFVIIELGYFLIGIIGIQIIFDLMFSHKIQKNDSVLDQKSISIQSENQIAPVILTFITALKNISTNLEEKNYVPKLNKETKNRLEALYHVLHFLEKSYSQDLKKIRFQVFNNNKGRNYSIYSKEEIVGQLLCDVLYGLCVDASENPIGIMIGNLKKLRPKEKREDIESNIVIFSNEGEKHEAKVFILDDIIINSEKEQEFSAMLFGNMDESYKFHITAIMNAIKQIITLFHPNIRYFIDEKIIKDNTPSKDINESLLKENNSLKK